MGTTETPSAHTLRSLCPEEILQRSIHLSQPQSLTESLLELKGEVVLCRCSQEAKIIGEPFEGNLSTPCYLPFPDLQMSLCLPQAKKKAETGSNPSEAAPGQLYQNDKMF